MRRGLSVQPMGRTETSHASPHGSLLIHLLECVALKRPLRVVRGILGPALLSLCVTLGGCEQNPIHTDRRSAPDLGLDWPEEPNTAARRDSAAGGTFRYRLYNQGDGDAYAVIVEAHTALGPLHPPQRLEPGPRAGETIDSEEHFSVVDGMQELCLEVRLQTLAADAPQDRNPANNRICRDILPARENN